MKRIENVQKRALQIVFNDRISDYSDLLKKANTCTIKTKVEETAHNRGLQSRKWSQSILYFGHVSRKNN